MQPHEMQPTPATLSCPMCGSTEFSLTIEVRRWYRVTRLTPEQLSAVYETQEAITPWHAGHEPQRLTCDRCGTWYLPSAHFILSHEHPLAQ